MKTKAKEIKSILSEFYEQKEQLAFSQDEVFLPPAYIADKKDWIRHISRGTIVDHYFVYTCLLSVPFPESKSMTGNLLVINLKTFEFHTQNITVRRDQGKEITLAGFSNSVLLPEELDQADEDDYRFVITEEVELAAIQQFKKLIGRK